MIFVDTSFFYPLFSVDDEDHGRVREVFESYRGRRLRDLLVTTNHVVFETITLIRMNVGHQAAVTAGERLYAERMARIHRATFDEERAAFEYLKKYKDHEYSAVDCLSFIIMEKLGIAEALAVDSDFTHRFVAHPGPRPK